jgi:hypothetical protein
MDDTNHDSMPNEQELADMLGITAEELRDRHQMIVEQITYPVILKMLDNKLIDPKKSNDRVYLWGVVHNNLRDILKPGFEVTIVIHNEFIEIAKYCLEIQKYTTALVLIATALEHVINLYYRNLLSDKGLPERQITDIIKKSNVDAKLGWMLLITSNTTIPTDLHKDITKIFELRNAIVHHKYVPEKMDVEEGSWGDIEPGIKKLDFSKFIEIPEELDEILTQCLCKLTPNRGIAFEMWRVMFDKGG